MSPAIPSLVFLAIGASIVVCIALAYFRYSARARASRKLRQTPRVQIAQARDGEVVKLVGKLRLDTDDRGLTAPLSKRRCAHFELTIKRKQSSGNTSYWKTIIEERGSQAFWLVDPSGEALIEAISPEVVLTIDAHRKSGTFNDATPDLEALLARHGESSKGWVFNKNMRYQEGALEPGEFVAVIGRCRWEPDPDPQAAGGGYRERPKRLVVGDPPDARILITDDLSLLR